MEKKLLKVGKWSVKNALGFGYDGCLWNPAPCGSFLGRTMRSRTLSRNAQSG